MRISEAIAGVKRLCIETTPFIYFVEEHPTYVDRVQVIIDRIDSGEIEGISSVVTLTEVLMQPIRRQETRLEQAYRRILLYNKNFMLVSISKEIATLAAYLRAEHNLKTPDALQVAAAVASGCDAFLTNDAGIKRVTDIRVLVLDELELDPPLSA